RSTQTNGRKGEGSGLFCFKNDIIESLPISGHLLSFTGEFPMAANAKQLQDQLLLECCIRKMYMGAFILGASDSKAAQGGNLAFIEVKNNGNEILHKQAFSNSSSLPKAVKADFAPSVPQTSLGMVGIPNGNQHANHTEPKLLEHIKNNL